MKKTDIHEFLGMENTPLIDVRSPKEFLAGHIPGAISIPLFSDEERAVVGTAYTQQSQHQAIREGLMIAGKNMADYIKALERITDEHQCTAVRLHCWRGGMRSESMAWLFDKLVEQTFVLTGGYKAYRRELMNFFNQPLRLAILTGNTGSGKTRILHELARQGQQVIDLEGLANHQGSSFGNQKTTGQPSTEQFQNFLFDHFRHLDLSRPVWLEDESFCIGGACLPENLFEQMQSAPRYLIRVEKERRVRNLLSDYGNIPPEKLIAATRGIQRKLGKRLAEEAEELITGGDLAAAASILLGYYDKRYEKSLARSKDQVVASLDISRENDQKIAQSLIENLYVR